MPSSKRYKVEFSSDAERDLNTIHEYLVDHQSTDFADKWLDRLLALVESLEQFPMSGSIPKEFEAIGRRSYRQALLPPYRIFYRVLDDRVIIGLIADGRRDMQTLLRQRLLSR